jgi:PTH1 family peptidyl-tRNA hydrolase
MKILVGLGNPEKRYENTRHNAGFHVIDYLATKHGAEFKQQKDFRALVAKTILVQREVLLVKPLTYMNLSGQAVSAIINWFKVPISELLVMHDDVSLPLGRIRLQKGGGAGGQHGVESIIASLGGNKEFHRVKIGVGPDPGGDRRADYVLSMVPPIDVELWNTSIGKSAEAVLAWLENGLQPTMNVFNGLVFGLPEVLRLAEQAEAARAAAQAKRAAEAAEKLAAEANALSTEADRTAESNSGT